ncbi:hypothetical protein COO60DRAFT_1533710 [Scenedesmus sp. NREL 46B-D3]|nr:hypothetical protein COO60DRAFT_1533710 [Scenedesmus sp. NREL 46B-D3]
MAYTAANYTSQGRIRPKAVSLTKDRTAPTVPATPNTSTKQTPLDCTSTLPKPRAVDPLHPALSPHGPNTMHIPTNTQLLAPLAVRLRSCFRQAPAAQQWEQPSSPPPASSQPASPHQHAPQPPKPCTTRAHDYRTPITKVGPLAHPMRLPTWLTHGKLV